MKLFQQFLKPTQTQSQLKILNFFFVYQFLLRQDTSLFDECYNSNIKSQMTQEQSSPSESKIKQMRRIAEKAQAPTDKTQLISFLSQRISQAQDALNDTEQLLQSEIKQRQKISQLIQQRNNQLEKLYEVDQRGLPDKIRQRLTEILTTTISQKVDAEEELHEGKTKNYEYQEMYKELKWEQKNITHKLDEQKQKESNLNQEISRLESENITHEEELTELQTNLKEIKEKKQNLQNKYLQMKVALQRMTDIRAVLNRFFGNEDLFDEKMDLKEQKIHRVQVQSRQNQNRQPTKDTKTNTNKLKPLNYTSKNEDEDFWRGDFGKNTKI